MATKLQQEIANRQENKPEKRAPNTIKGLLSSEGYQKRLHEILGERKAQFVTSVTSLVNTNIGLAECVPSTVINACIKGASLDLPIDPNLGFAWVIPYNNRKKGVKEATFQLGYKGYVQLALRTGQYKAINVIDVREGELKSFNPLSEEIEIDFADDRESLKVIGYCAYFRLVNGFEKTVYWSVSKVDAHAKRYSPEYKKYGSGKWKDDFDGMAKKTMIKNILSKWGILSIDMQTAIKSDQAVIDTEGDIEDYQYPDAEEIKVEEQPDQDGVYPEDGEIKFPEEEKKKPAPKKA